MQPKNTILVEPSPSLDCDSNENPIMYGFFYNNFRNTYISIMNILPYYLDKIDNL